MNKPGTYSDALSGSQLAELATRIKEWGGELGFQQLGITDTDLGCHEKLLQNWI